MTTSYATVEDLRKYLKQIKLTDELTSLYEIILANATDIVNHELKFKFDGYQEESRLCVTGYGQKLFLPAYHRTGSVTEVSFNGQKLEGWYEWKDREDKPACVFLTKNWRFEDVTSCMPNLPQWKAIGEQVLVTAEWGYGEVPDAVKQVVLELSVNIKRSADAGRFSNRIGVAGGGEVEYTGDLTHLEKRILNNVRMAYQPRSSFGLF